MLNCNNVLNKICYLYFFQPLLLSDVPLSFSSSQTSLVNGRTRWKEWAKIIEKGNGKADELAAKVRESQWQEEFPSHPEIQNMV